MSIKSNYFTINDYKSNCYKRRNGSIKELIKFYEETNKPKNSSFTHANKNIKSTKNNSDLSVIKNNHNCQDSENDLEKANELNEMYSNGLSRNKRPKLTNNLKEETDETYNSSCNCSNNNSKINETNYSSLLLLNYNKNNTNSINFLDNVDNINKYINNDEKCEFSSINNKTNNTNQNEYWEFESSLKSGLYHTKKSEYGVNTCFSRPNCLKYNINENNDKISTTLFTDSKYKKQYENDEFIFSSIKKTLEKNLYNINQHQLAKLDSTRLTSKVNNNDYDDEINIKSKKFVSSNSQMKNNKVNYPLENFNNFLNNNIQVPLNNCKSDSNSDHKISTQKILDYDSSNLIKIENNFNRMFIIEKANENESVLLKKNINSTRNSSNIESISHSIEKLSYVDDLTGLGIEQVNISSSSTPSTSLSNMSGIKKNDNFEDKNKSIELTKPNEFENKSFKSRFNKLKRTTSSLSASLNKKFNLNGKTNSEILNKKLETDKTINKSKSINNGFLNSKLKQLESNLERLISTKRLFNFDFNSLKKKKDKNNIDNNNISSMMSSSMIITSPINMETIDKNLNSENYKSIQEIINKSPEIKIKNKLFNINKETAKNDISETKLNDDKNGNSLVNNLSMYSFEKASSKSSTKSTSSYSNASSDFISTTNSSKKIDSNLSLLSSSTQNDYQSEKANNLFIKQTFEKTENIGIKSSTASTSSSISSDSLSSSPTSSAFSISPNLSNNFVSSSSSSKPKISYLVKSQSICLSKQNSNQTKHHYSEIKKSNSVRKYDPRTVQKSLLEWCQIKTKNYQNVNIKNFSTSWSDGLAFCALIHSHMPDAFDFNKLNLNDRRENFELAFNTAYIKANIIPLLEVNDMILMGDRPDNRCIFTYVSTIYTRFKELNSLENNQNYKNENLK